jgi:methionyl-tRNA formyltransferase
LGSCASAKRTAPSPHATTSPSLAKSTAPGAFTTLGSEVLKLFVPTLAEGHGAPGAVLLAREGLVVACGDGAVRFADAQLPNKRRLPVAELVRGRPIAPGTVLGGKEPA